MADEKAEHQRCTPWRAHGREWYELNDATRRVVAEAIEAERRNVEADYAPGSAVPRPPRPRPAPPRKRTVHQQPLRRR